MRKSLWCDFEWRLIELEHRGNHTASSGSTLEEMLLEDVLAVVAGPAVVALERSKESKN